MTTTPGVSTLVASANIGRADRPNARGHKAGSPFDHLSIGQHLKMQVLRQLEQHRYEVTFGGRRHVVESHVTLQAGSQISAQVEGKGAKLELRYLGAAQGGALTGDMAAAEITGKEAAPASGLETLAAQYRVPLDARMRQIIERAAAQAREPDSMAMGGLFLQKLAGKVDAQDLEALYRALNPDERAPLAAAASTMRLEDLANGDDLAATLADALDSAMPEMAGAAPGDAGADVGGQTGEDAQRAARLLNLQDEGSVAWRFGTLPMLVGGQLIELDLVMFRERDAHARRGGLRRLVMTLDTTHFGRVHVEARAVDSRLMVTLSAASSDALEILSAYGNDVRGAIESLGWAVDEVRYELGTPQSAAAQSVVQHVLSAGSVDREL